MLHCLVFKEQLCLSKLSRFKRLIYCIAASSFCQELFSFHFEDFGVHEIHERLPIKELHLISFMSAGVLRRLVLYYRKALRLSTSFCKKIKEILIT